MTNLPLWRMTAGLKLPADSHPLPRGEMMGSFETRVQGASVQFCADKSRPEANRTTRLRRRVQARIIIVRLSKTGNPKEARRGGGQLAYPSEYVYRRCAKKRCGPAKRNRQLARPE